MVTPEGEKLHSDSGISVDSQSLQEQHQQQQQQAQAEVQSQPSHAQEHIGKPHITNTGNSANYYRASS